MTMKTKELVPIDVSGFLREFEIDLRNRQNQLRHARALAVLSRWQADERIDAASRKRAQELIDEYNSQHGHRLG